MRLCSKCKVELKKVFVDCGYEQYDNCLWIKFEGGYGEFVDPIDSGDQSKLTLSLCHDCAHQFIDDNPWMSEVIDPEHSHTHSIEYREKNPTHCGFDYDLYD